MSDPAAPPPNPDVDSLRLRHVLTLVVAGVALGVLFNALQLSADTARGVDWVKRERRVVSLGELLPAANMAVADTVARAIPKEPATGLHSTPRSGVPAAGRRARPSAPPAEAAPPARAPVPRPVPASTAAPAPSPGLPVIPDSRDPIEVGIDVVRAYHSAGAALLLDARSAEAYAEGHIAGAANIPFDEVFKNPELVKTVEAKGRVLITYCGGGDCDLSRNLAFSLLDAGHKEVLVFKGGLPEWISAGGGVRTGAQP